MLLHNAHDGVKGERIVCICRSIKRQRVVPGSHAHRAIEIVVEGTPAKCFVLKPVRSLQ
jgi:hypothetical protein